MKKIFTLFVAMMMIGTMNVFAKWDGTVTVSVKSFSSLADLSGITLTLPGAESIEVLEGEDAAYLCVQNQDGDKLYGFWYTGFGQTATVNGNAVTFDSFVTVEDMTENALPTEDCDLIISDYCVLKVDGEAVYMPDVTISYKSNSTPEPEKGLDKSIAQTYIDNSSTLLEQNKAILGDKYVTYSEALNTLQDALDKATTAQEVSTVATSAYMIYDDIKREVEIATGINAVSTVAPAKVAKMIENGKVVIVKNGKKFNVNGQEL